MKSNSAKRTKRQISRRSFMKTGLGVLSAVAVLEVGGAGLMFLRSRSLEGEFGGVIAAGPVDRFPPASVTEFTEARFFLIRSQDGGFLATHIRCPHLGCTVNWKSGENRFLCPCHASHFDFYGNFEKAPVSRALDTFSVQIKDGQVTVNTAILQQRDRFTPEQLVYA